MKDYNISEEQIKQIIAQQLPGLMEAPFRNKNYITGDEIVRFSPHAQVNKFILFQIYQEWNLYISRIHHPYFDFQHEEVKSGLRTFQNVLSRHIRIDKFDFRQLVEKAIYNSLKLILSPDTSLVNFFFLNKERLPIQLYEKYANYFSDFDFIVLGILNYCRKHGIEKVDKSEFQEKMHRLVDLYEKKTGQSMDQYRDGLFREITGQPLSTYVQPGERDTADTDLSLELDLTSDIPPAQEASAPRQATTEQRPADRPQISTPSPRTPEVPDTRSPAMGAYPVESELPAAGPQPPQPSETPPPSTSPAPSASEERPAESAEEPQVTRLADQFRQQQEPSRLNDVLKQSKSLRIDQIPLHKQFQFLQKIFSGNHDKFRESIDALNRLSTLEEAEHYLNTRLLNKPDVSRSDKVTLEFVQMVRNHFQG